MAASTHSASTFATAEGEVSESRNESQCRGLTAESLSNPARAIRRANRATELIKALSLYLILMYERGRVTSDLNVAITDLPATIAMLLR